MGMRQTFQAAVETFGRAVSTFLHGTPAERAFLRLEAEENRLLKSGRRPESAPSFQRLETEFLRLDQQERAGLHHH